MATENPTAPPTRQPIKLVVVEDDENDREFLVRLILKAGIEDHIEFIDSGEKAVEYFVPEIAPTIFAVFLDIHLRNVDGLQVLKHLRAQPATAQLPVIMMTGSKDPAHLRECEVLKVAGFLTKPIEFPEFCRAISFLLENSA